MSVGIVGELVDPVGSVLESSPPEHPGTSVKTRIATRTGRHNGAELFTRSREHDFYVSSSTGQRLCLRASPRDTSPGAIPTVPVLCVESLLMHCSNTYAQLPDRFYQRVEPTPVREPRLLLFNTELADELGLDPNLRNRPDELANLFGGNQKLPGSDPLALAYAGHQFGNFVPQLGDGRAHLLGEIVDRQGTLRDLQLKGSGPTAFSRGGDGRCALGPAVREYIMSEAMHALNISTTRSLAVVMTGEPVIRHGMLPGAVVTRVARSHIRVGTFQYFAVRGDTQGLQLLADYTINRLYPQLKHQANHYLGLLNAVIASQIEVVTDWLRVGFIHGVMNTDNTTISGETIDYGPCAMMGRYDPATVFSSIDHRGRYAYGNQPAIIAWNMARLAEAMLPLFSADQDEAIERAQACIETVPERLDNAWQTMMAGKLGLPNADADEDRLLVTELLQHMHRKKLDYTITFDRLTRSHPPDELDPAWVQTWHRRLAAHHLDVVDAKQSMQQQNPVVIPRNHHVEAVLSETQTTGDASRVEAFVEVLRSPYQQLPTTEHYQDPPVDGDQNYVTYCGT